MIDIGTESGAAPVTVAEMLDWSRTRNARFFSTKSPSRLAAEALARVRWQEKEDASRAAEAERIREEEEKERQRRALELAREERLKRIGASLTGLPPVAMIVAHTERHFRMPPGTIRSRRRHARTSLARHIAMFIAKETSSRSLPDIARRFGMDHTTVLHGINRIARLIQSDPDIELDVACIRASLDEIIQHGAQR